MNMPNTSIKVSNIRINVVPNKKNPTSDHDVQKSFRRQDLTEAEKIVERERQVSVRNMVRSEQSERCSEVQSSLLGKSIYVGGCKRRGNKSKGTRDS